MRKKVLGILVFSFLFSSFVSAQETNFYIDSYYDLSSRSQISAQLIYSTNKLYFYIDNYWWSQLSFPLRQQFLQQLFYLASYFENRDYSLITSTFGFEIMPGLDQDNHLYVLFHPLKEKFAGYVRLADIFPKNQINSSNEHEMIYLDPGFILNTPSQKISYYLSHEFLHLVSFNFKKEKMGNLEERWLTEARSEYLATFLGYNQDYLGSFLENRVRTFQQNPNFSLINFGESASDYAAVNLLAHYLVDHYGLKILIDSLKSPFLGIASLNEALVKNGFAKNFEEVFFDWLLALLFNDCQINSFSCYKNPHLVNFKVYPYSYYLPEISSSRLKAINNLKIYSPQWLKIAGGRGELRLNYQFPSGLRYYLGAITVDQNNQKKLQLFTEKNGYQGMIEVPNFGKENIALYLIPLIIEGKGESFGFQWEASFSEKVQQTDYLSSLVEQIAQLKKQIAYLTEQLKVLISQKESFFCSSFQNDLYYGLLNNQEVKCLQKFLKEKEPDLYPSGLITGNYLDLTQEAVRKLQLKYHLPPTGYFGPLTRSFLNQKLGF